MPDEKERQRLESLDFADSELRYNRFMRPMYTEALQRLGLPAGGVGLDAGCGPGGLFEVLAETAGPPGRIVGVDVSYPHLERARALGANLSVPTTLLQADMRQSLPLEDGSVDWTWCADVLWGSYFPEPRSVVSEFRRVTRPGGTVAVFFVETFRNRLLPGFGRLEGRASLASDLAWQRDRNGNIKMSVETHQEHARRWLRQAGLTDLRVECLALTYEQPLPVEALEYVRDYAFAESYGPALQELGGLVGIGEEDLRTWTELTDPASRRYVFNDPDYYCSMYGTLAWGRVPQEG